MWRIFHVADVQMEMHIRQTDLQVERGGTKGYLTVESWRYHKTG